MTENPNPKEEKKPSISIRKIEKLDSLADLTLTPEAPEKPAPLKLQIYEIHDLDSLAVPTITSHAKDPEKT